MLFTLVNGILDEISALHNSLLNSSCSDGLELGEKY
jgi:hypothetical protein